MKDLSIIIPSRHEMFLKNTVEDVLKNIEADTEIIVGLDGEWPIEPLPQHERLNVVLANKAIGQRAVTNLACKLSRAKYVMKIDAHCAFDKGFDRKMLEAFKKTGDNVTMVPVMRNLWAFDWKCYHCGWKKYQGPTPEKCEQCGKSDKIRRKIIWQGKSNPQSTSYCFDSAPHFQYFGEYKNRPEYKKGKKEGLTETMSLQGSCFMLTRKKYWELNICDEKLGNWGNQGIETACKTWLSGGRVLCNHKTWYAHMFRTQGGDFTFPWPVSGKDVQETKEKTWQLFFGYRWPLQKKPVSWLLEKFWPVRGWTDEDLKKLKAKEAKPVSEKPIKEQPKMRISKKLPSSGIIFSAQPTKGIIYYTDNQLKLKIAHTVQNQLQKVSQELDIPIVSASLKPMTHFGDQNIYFPSLKRGSLTMLRQILGALENTWTDIVFFCEHDVLYHPSHFEFTPPRKDKFYYNQNFWKLRLEDGYALHYDANQTSALCCYKELAIEEFRKRRAKVEKEGNKSNLDFELIANDRNFGTWKSALPIIDIRHSHNLTKNRWSQDDFRNSCQGWWETDDEIPGWGKTKELIKKFKSKMKYDVNKNKIQGWMDKRELLWLFNTAKGMDSVIEIGSWKGRSTHALLSGCKGTVYAIDHFLGSLGERETTHVEAKTRDIYKDFMENVGSFKNLQVLKMDNAEAVKHFEDKSIDMVFIDAGHTYEEALSDIKRWLPKTKKIICGHDLEEGGVKLAVKKMFGNEFETDRGRIWIKRIKKLN